MLNFNSELLLPIEEQDSMNTFLDKMITNAEKQNLCCGFRASIEIIKSVGSPFDAVAQFLDARTKQGVPEAPSATILMAYFLDRLGCPKVPIEYSCSFNLKRVTDMERWADLVLLQIAIHIAPILNFNGASNLCHLLSTYYFFVQDSAKEIFNAPTV